MLTIEDMVRQGKVLNVGVSEWTASQIQEGLSVADRYLLDRIVVNQPQYNMFNRTIESEIIPLSERNGVSQVVFSPHVASALVGATRIEQLEENVKAAGVVLPADVVQKIEEILA
ncbi:hypothetical protein GCM10008018_34510 [Paenibacillus marchantiophytorum]|uniref:NADP-dependent oxidoreductase domain-containing protein n=1 Tax=Paenibacillus marchantiophytorum TaxID=1619310 RepID=A0ABQ1ESN9_9BACL|nr:hypothetical protein GCM10008018_34510 [Paenibacillus marchantiophytorum]